MIKPKKSINGKKAISEKFFSLFPIARDLIFQRWLLAISVSLVLSLTIYPQIIYDNLPDYSVGSIATSNIKADRDFLVEDAASTKQKRLLEMEEVRPVYDYDSNMPAQMGIILAKAFLAAGEDLRNAQKPNDPNFNKQLRSTFEELSTIKLTNNEYNTLYKYKFSFDICNDAVKLIYNIYNRGPVSDETIKNVNQGKGIIILDVKTQEEREIDDLSFITVMTDINKLIQEDSNAVLKDRSKQLIPVTVSLASKMIRPNLTFAKNTTENRRQIAWDSIKPVFYKVQKNEMIVREGEKITPPGLDKLNALFHNQEGKSMLNISAFLGMFLTALLLSYILYKMFENTLKSLKKTNIDLLLLSLTTILQLLLAKAGIFICTSVEIAFDIIPSNAIFFAIPLTVGAMLITLLLNRQMGLIFAVGVSFLVAFLFDDKMSMFLFSFIGSAIATHRIIRCKQRSDFFKAGLLIGLANMAIIISLSLLSGNLLTTNTIIKLIMGMVGGISSGIIVSGTIPLFEAFLGYTTDIKLLELANLNQPIFQQMIMVAPGTYHHSIVVASMVESAAEAINANSLLAKVSAYYHDIGKIKKPIYYIENQENWENKHDSLTPQMSSLVIISHVKDGCALAKEYKLGRPIIDIIRQHHGTSIVSYFYEKAKKNEEISGQFTLESDFRYPGPKPLSKEAGLVLLGDVIEASSRTLKNPTPSRIKNHVVSRIRQILAEGQLDESELTLRDLNKIGESFNRILTGIFHHRIDYSDHPIEVDGKGKGRNGGISKKSAKKNKNRRPKDTEISIQDFRENQL
ncbi:MAG: HDIG domain-containing protein [Deltaproteobacteria bacterium]|nr:HDIG domain-containing protein [Deltaproteobacteria bacterium]